LKNPTNTTSVVLSPPACAYRNYLSHIVDDQQEDKENHPDKKKKTYNNTAKSKNGTLYQLPNVPFQLAFGNHARKQKHYV
jgi:hypothetical protein